MDLYIIFESERTYILLRGLSSIINLAHVDVNI